MDEPTVCPANIDTAGRKRRTVTGVVVLGTTLAVHFALVRGNDRLWTLAEFPTLLFGWLCLVQALDRTCVVLAARGTQETDAGTVPVADAAVAAALRRRAAMVWVKADVAAMISVALLYFFAT